MYAVLYIHTSPYTCSYIFLKDLVFGGVNSLNLSKSWHLLIGRGVNPTVRRCPDEVALLIWPFSSIFQTWPTKLSRSKKKHNLKFLVFERWRFDVYTNIYILRALSLWMKNMKKKIFVRSFTMATTTISILALALVLYTYNDYYSMN